MLTDRQLYYNSLVNHYQLLSDKYTAEIGNSVAEIPELCTCVNCTLRVLRSALLGQRLLLRYSSLQFYSRFIGLLLMTREQFGIKNQRGERFRKDCHLNVWRDVKEGCFDCRRDD